MLDLPLHRHGVQATRAHSTVAGLGLLHIQHGTHAHDPARDAPPMQG